MNNKNIVKKSYWDNRYSTDTFCEPINPYLTTLNNYVNRRFHFFFKKIFADINTGSKELLEIGCACSQWLPYFSKYFSFKVSGLDYSEIGCKKTRQILEKENISGKIITADLFSPPEYCLNNYSVIISFGVIEHFSKPEKCISAFSRFLKSDGLMITIIPNMMGLTGYAQKFFNRRAYDMHVLIDKEYLKTMHNNSGLKVIFCDYFLFINLGVLNIENFKKHFLLYSSLVHLRSWLNKGIWILEKVGLLFIKPNYLTSPYIVCVAKKK